MADRFGAWASFDDEERSGTYAERVEWCPECGAWLNTHALLTADGKGLRGGAEL